MLEQYLTSPATPPFFPLSETDSGFPYAAAVTHELSQMMRSLLAENMQFPLLTK
jgi:hypothetical protein